MYQPSYKERLLCWENGKIVLDYRWGNSGNSVRLYFLGSKITADGDCSHELKDTYSLEEKL